MMSMTGYGRSVWNDDRYNIEVEIRSLNSRYFKFTAKIPQEYNKYEIDIKNIVAKKIQRGTISISLNYLDTENSSITINADILKKYYNTLKDIGDNLGIAPPQIGELLSLPEVTVSTTTAEIPDFIWLKTQEMIDKALSDVQEMRKKEGKEILCEQETFCTLIENHLEKIILLVPEALKSFKERIHSRIIQFSQDEKISVGEQDIIKELAVFADKVDINEEISRLKSHLRQFRFVMKKQEPIGKTLDFLAQEMLRESNTIASKSNHAECSQCVVEMKTILEQMREQIQNLE